MLRELYELSTHFEKQPLGYSQIGVMWQIDVGDRKPSLQLLETTDAKGKSKPGKKLLVPDLRRNNDKALLIDDSAEYVFGIGPRGEKRNPLYLEVLQHCIEATQDEGAKRVLDFLQTCDLDKLDQEASEQNPPPKDKKGNPKPRDRFWWYRDRIIFLLDNQPISQQPAIREFWANYYRQEQGTVPATCLLTGQDQDTIRDKMPAMVKGVPNTQSSGAALISFDKDAYQVYGWDGNTNAPIGFDPAVAIHQTLDRLLKDPQHHYRSGNQMFIFWGNRQEEGITPKFWDDPTAEEVSNLITRPDKGLPPSSEQFYLGVLKGNKGRIALSYWDERKTETLLQSIKQFVTCQQQFGDNFALPLWRLRNAAFRDPKKEHTEPIDLALVRSALFGETLPDIYAQKVIHRIHQERDVLRPLDRAKALAFYSHTTMNQSHRHQKTEVLAYRLGRMAFFMHWAQYTAQNLSREETNVSRSLRVLSTTPALVFSRLYEGCIVNHLEDRQAQEQRGGILHNLKTRLNEEFAQLDYDPASDLPTTFTVREQAQFFLGFGKARAEYFQQKAKSEDNDND